MNRKNESWEMIFFSEVARALTIFHFSRVTTSQLENIIVENRATVDKVEKKTFSHRRMNI